jgi:uncharacterized membrane protein YfcA
MCCVDLTDLGSSCAAVSLNGSLDSNVLLVLLSLLTCRSAASVIWFLVAGIAVSCGVGGGGIYVPMGMILLRFPPKPSAGLSQACIFGAGIGGLFINGRKRHPDRHIRDTKGLPSEKGQGKIVPYETNMTHSQIEADRKRYLQGGDGQRKFYTRPVIDYDLLLLMAPMELAGAVFGVTVQRVLPDWLFLSFAVLVLGFTCLKTYKKVCSSLSIPF